MLLLHIRQVVVPRPELCDRNPPPTRPGPGHHRDRPITYQAFGAGGTYTCARRVTRPTDRNVRAGLSRSRATNARRQSSALGRHVLLFIILYYYCGKNKLRETCGGRVLAGVRASRLCPSGTGRLINRRAAAAVLGAQLARARDDPVCCFVFAPGRRRRRLIFYYIVTVRSRPGTNDEHYRSH